MRSDILPGDLVKLLETFGDGTFKAALVIGVRQANEVPDAEARGMVDLQPWSYYVMTSDPVKFRGPFMRSQLHLPG